MSELSIMNEVKLLDVTLRDGGLTNNFDFSSEVVNHVVSELDKSSIEYIEVGFRNGLQGAPAPDMGPAGFCRKDYLQQCRKLIRSSKLTVMFHPKNLQKSDYEEMHQCGVDSLRMCVGPNQDLDQTLQSVAMAKELGFEVFVNIMFVSKYKLDSLQQLVFQISQNDPKAIYLADSVGTLIPEQVTEIFTFLKKSCNTDFGYHGHDSLFLAQANNLAAINCGVKYIDASLTGLGAGVGNLRTEGIVSLLRSQGCTKHNVPEILNLADYFNLNVRNEKNSLPLKAMIAGIFNLSKEDQTHLDQSVDIIKYYDLAEEYAKKM